jgi:phosphonoacetaldehyde hydrolase
MRLQGIILDWAGTTVDYGCIAPVQVFVEIFRSIGIEPTMEEVRAPMGVSKWDHIRAMLDMHRIGALFTQKFGRPYTHEDVDHLHELFEPNILDVLNRFADPLPHVLDIVRKLRLEGYTIGSTTGYNDKMMQIVARNAELNGYAPDYWITADSTKSRGRPYPYMIYANIIRLDMGMPEQVVKVGDTLSDIQEGRNAGVWTIGVLKGSSMLGLSEAEATAMSELELSHKMVEAKQAYIQSGAHDVIEDLSGLFDAMELINQRMARGEKPFGQVS